MASSLLAEVFAANPSGTVSSGGTTAPSAGTSETWTVSVSAAFGALYAGVQHFYAADKALPGEVFEVIACPGSTGSQTWTVLRGASGTTPVAHSAGFTVTQVIGPDTLDSLRRREWQFRPEDYGARGDAIIGTGGTGSSGSATFTDAGASFTSADAGKVIVINQGTSGAGTANGTTQNPFCGTISAVNSATSVTLSGTLGAACASAPYIYGTDDQPAIQACITAAATWAQSNGWYAEVQFRPRTYMLKALTQATSPDKINTHLKIPYPAQTGQRLTVRLLGAGRPENEYWQSTVPQLNGTCLVSGIFPGTQPDATYGQVSMIGGPSAQIAAGEFANVRLEIDRIALVAPWNSQIYGVDGRWIAQMSVPYGLYMAFTPTNTTGASIGGPYSQNIPSNGIGAGFAFPWASNNAANSGFEVIAMTVPYGVLVSEHTTFTRLTGLYTTSACYITSTPSVPHALTIQHLCCEGSANALDASAASLSGTTVPVNIGMVETESMTNSIVNDPNSVLTGLVMSCPGGSSFVTVIGGNRLTVLDGQIHSPGPWSGAPAAPSSGTAQQNLSYRPATVWCSASTSITSVATGAPGVSSGLTSVTVTAGANVAVPVRVPPGAYFSVTYSGTLTTHWVLD